MGAAFKHPTPNSLIHPSFGLVFFSQVMGAHPLITEELAPKGAGNYQLELTYDSNQLRVDRATSLVKPQCRFFHRHPWRCRLHLRTAPPKGYRARRAKRTSRKLGNSEIAFKWRFYEEDALRLAVRPRPAHR